MDIVAPASFEQTKIYSLRYNHMALPNTHYGAEVIKKMLEKDGQVRLFFDGIGGISMNALAHISHLYGFTVSGYDRTPTPITKKLEDMGIVVYYTASETHMQNCDALIYTVAMNEDNPEYCYSLTHGIPVISRADFLGYLMHGFHTRIGVAGTHGKSTTTAMLDSILTNAAVLPTVIGGAEMKSTGTVDRIGEREYFVFEACEYMDSFLDFYPTIAVVLNIELDHVDYFSSIDAIRTSFTSFMRKTGTDGCAVINADDPQCLLAVREYDGKVVTFGVENSNADYSAEIMACDKGRYMFRIRYGDGITDAICLRVPGKHCVADAVAAFAAAHTCGISANDIVRGLTLFDGIARRMEQMGKTKRGADIYTDYAHHPTEIVATLEGSAQMGYHHIYVVFQPHTYSRTSELFADFCNVLAKADVEEIVLCPIYAARETNVYGVTSEMLGAEIREKGQCCKVCSSLHEAAIYCREKASEDDMILVMGAGDVIHVAEELMNI